MGYVNEPSEGAKFRAVRWEDRDDIQRWLTALHNQMDDLAAAARDRARAKWRQVLSRHEAGRRIRAAWRAIKRLFEAAEAALRAAPPPDPFPNAPPPAGEEDAPLSEERALPSSPGGEGA